MSTITTVKPGHRPGPQAVARLRHWAHQQEDIELLRATQSKVDQDLSMTDRNMKMARAFCLASIPAFVGSLGLLVQMSR